MGVLKRRGDGMAPRVGVVAGVLILIAASVAPSGANPTFEGRNGRIAFTRNGDVFTMSARGGAVEKLTRGPAFDTAFWSPDGSKLAVVRQGDTASLHVMNADGTQKERLPIAVDGSIQHLEWSPDGSKIVFTDMDISNPDARAPYPAAIKVFDVASGTQTTLFGPSPTAGNPTWSPDGSQIAFGMEGDAPGLYVAGADGSNPRLIAEKGAGSPDWSPDGNSIVFTFVVTRPNGSTRAARIHATSPQGTHHTELTAGTPFDIEPTWSPDGSRILFTRDDQGLALWTMAANGENEKRLASADFSGVWSPNGSKVAYARGGDIFKVSSDGTNERRLTRTRALDSSPAWQARP